MVRELNNNGKVFKGRVLFDNGSQTTLVRDRFANDMGWSYINNCFSLAGVGSMSNIIQGKLYDINILGADGSVYSVKGYGVSNILNKNWSYPALTYLSKFFPKIPVSVFSAQDSRPIDILVGVDALNLIPRCSNGINCVNCESGLCCYKSKFGLGWVSVGVYNKVNSEQANGSVTLAVLSQDKVEFDSSVSKEVDYLSLRPSILTG